MSKKKPPLKQRFMLCVLLKAMTNMLERNNPTLTDKDIEQEYIKFIKENFEEFVNNPFFRN